VAVRGALNLSNCAAARTSMMMTRPDRVQKRKRFILVDREHGNVLGDTGYDWNGQPVPRISGLYPVKAAAMLQSRGATDHYPYRYRTIRRSHPNAVFDAYRAAPGFPRAAEGSPPDAVTRACEYVASLERLHPHCSVCRKPMAPSQLGIDSPWRYGYAIGWNDPQKRCCSGCYVNRVLPARLKAEGTS
jgi:hypothetical protein